MTGMYRLLLKLYPQSYRSVFGTEMLSVFRDAQRDASLQGAGCRIVFYLREGFGLVSGAVHHHLLRLRLSRQPECNFGGTMDQRSQCLFPRFTIVMMVIIFLMVIEIIAKGDGISHYLFRTYSATGQPVGWDLGRSIRYWPSHYRLISGIAVGFLIAWFAGIAAWTVAYALRRTGVQRFDQFQTWPQSHR